MSNGRKEREEIWGRWQDIVGRRIVYAHDISQIGFQCTQKAGKRPRPTLGNQDTSFGIFWHLGKVDGDLGLGHPPLLRFNHGQSERFSIGGKYWVFFFL
jgi:hypothetical protein